MQILCCLFLLLVGISARGADATAVVVSAANPKIGIAPDSLATVYGDKLATQTASAAKLPWPIALGDMPGVLITDSTSKAQPASLLYVSPTQMNIWIPPGTAPGPAIISFPSTGLPPGAGAAVIRSVPVTIQTVAPAIFSADGSGSGVAAATAVRVVLPTQMQGPVSVFQCGKSGTCAAIPIDVGIDAPVYLSLYGTGIARASSLANVVVTIGNVQLQPTYAGPQGDIPGLDQVNVPLYLTLRGSGLVNATVTVDGVTSNPVQVNVQ